MTPSREPIAYANIAAAIVAGLSLAVAMGWLSLSGDQFAEIERFLGIFGVIVAPLIAAWWARLYTTPLADPKVTLPSGQVVPLVRADTQQPTPQAQARKLGR